MTCRRVSTHSNDSTVISNTVPTTHPKMAIQRGRIRRRTAIVVAIIVNAPAHPHPVNGQHEVGHVAAKSPDL
jgi:hypothetical protein